MYCTVHSDGTILLRSESITKMLSLPTLSPVFPIVVALFYTQLIYISGMGAKSVPCHLMSHIYIIENSLYIYIYIFITLCNLY